MGVPIKYMDSHFSIYRISYTGYFCYLTLPPVIGPNPLYKLFSKITFFSSSKNSKRWAVISVQLFVTIQSQLPITVRLSHFTFKMNILFPRNRFFRRPKVVLPVENKSILGDFSSAGKTNHE